MEKVWAENREGLVKEIQTETEEALLKVCEQERSIQMESQIEGLRKKNLDLTEDKQQILEFGKKLGVDDVVFNNKVVLFKVKMKVKPFVNFEEEKQK